MKTWDLTQTHLWHVCVITNDPYFHFSEELVRDDRYDGLTALNSPAGLRFEQRNSDIVRFFGEHGRELGVDRSGH